MSTDKIISEYLKKIEKIAKSKKATEHSFRSDLKDLFFNLGEKHLKLDNLTIINEARRISCGSPDLLIEKDDIPFGYVEAKDIDINLDKMITTEQIQRYLKDLDNLIITNHLEFQWFVRGELKQKVSLCQIDEDSKKFYIESDKDTSKFIQLVTGFFEYFNQPAEKIYIPSELGNVWLILQKILLIRHMKFLLKTQKLKQNLKIKELLN